MSQKRVPDLIRRERALQAVKEKFSLKSLDLGKRDCLLLIRFHLVKMGHQRLPKPPKYSTLLGAKKALAGQGVENLEQLLDKHLTRITPAAMLPGDVALIASEAGAPAAELGTLVISVGRKFLGWHPDHPLFAVLEPTIESPFLAAWRA
ncbi:MAG TPA: hypothetical protein VM531_00240 [Sphingomicrobium sp.]|jgi:hypothetical protein|nr:hypothetical protein [Sphingomicrobium sp.]